MDKRKSTFSIAMGIACVWMGTHFGPGVASGTQIMTYWVKYGLWGTVCSILAMCLLGVCLYCSMEFSRVYKTYNYGDWAAWPGRLKPHHPASTFNMEKALALRKFLKKHG